MRIIIDINHPAHVNFFKNAVCRLFEDGHEITITVLERGVLPQIVFKEFGYVKCVPIGRRSGNIFSIVFEANLIKFFKMLAFVFKNDINIGLGVGTFLLGACLKFKGVPNIQFDDDIERKEEIFLEKATCTKLYFPPICKAGKKIKTYNASKEWAYLSPKYFNANQEALKEYNINPREYIFIREVDTATFNYRHQRPNLIESLAKQLPSSLKVLLSLENKSRKNYYPQEWILLKEPVKDIHSLMYFSKLVISSGDSIAREGALLGVPSIYCGFRKMAINKFVEKKGMFYQIAPKEVPEFVKKVVQGHINFENQDILRQKLFQEWDDVTKLIVKETEEYVRIKEKQWI